MRKVVPGSEEHRHPRDLSKARAWIQLSNAGKLLLMELYRRRTGQYEGPDDARRWVWDNNGQIEFPEEQYKLFGFTKPRFQRGKKDCAKWGFLSWTRGGGKDHVPCRYTLLDDWRKQGYVEFKRDKSTDTARPKVGVAPSRTDQGAAVRRDSGRKRTGTCIHCGGRLTPDFTCPKCDEGDDWGGHVFVTSAPGKPSGVSRNATGEGHEKMS